MTLCRRALLTAPALLLAGPVTRNPAILRASVSGNGAAVYTVGIGGAYPDIITAIAAARADPSVFDGPNALRDITLQVRRAGCTLRATTALSGFSMGPHTLTICAYPGEAFNDTWSDRNPGFPDTSLGAFLRMRGSGVDGMISAACGNLVLRDLVIWNDGNAGGTSTSHTIYWAGAPADTFSIERCMGYTEGETHHAPFLNLWAKTPGKNPTVSETNCLLVGKTATMQDFLAVYALLTTVDGVIYQGDGNTHIMIDATKVPQRERGGAGLMIANSGSVVQNTACIGFMVPDDTHKLYGFDFSTYRSPYFNPTVKASNNATDQPEFFQADFAPHGVTGASIATSFRSASDFRLRPGSVLAGRGKTSLAIDILRRPRHTPNDIGCFAL